MGVPMVVGHLGVLGLHAQKHVPVWVVVQQFEDTDNATCHLQCLVVVNAKAEVEKK